MSTFLEHLNAMREQLDVAIAAAKADGSGDKLMPIAAAGKSKAPKADKPAKKERANAGQQTAWAEFSNQKRLENKDACDAWVAARVASAKAGELFYTATDSAVTVKDAKVKVGDPIPVNKAAVGAHLTWVKITYKGEDQSEWKAFEAAWKEAHPKGSRAASVADDASESGSADGSDSAQEKPATAGKKRGAKKYSDMTPEELAAAKAKRAANKAKKTAEKEESEADERQSSCMEPASPVAAAIGGGGSVAAAAAVAEEAEEAEEAEVEQLPFTYKKINYLRLGTKDADGEIEWLETADLWLANADGSRGAYAGVLLATGKIDNSPETLANAPELE